MEKHTPKSPLVKTTVSGSVTKRELRIGNWIYNECTYCKKIQEN